MKATSIRKELRERSKKADRMINLMNKPCPWKFCESVIATVVIELFAGIMEF